LFAPFFFLILNLVTEKKKKRKKKRKKNKFGGRETRRFEKLKRRILFISIFSCINKELFEIIT